jgi:recombination protein RecR
MAGSDPLADLVTALQRLPGIGAPQCAAPGVFHPEDPAREADALCAAILSVKDRVTYCSICSNITAVDPCQYCASPDRDGRVLCVVEQPENVGAIERTRGFRGRYHVLMGAIAPLQGIGPDDLRIKSLLDRVAAGGIEEIIVATNPNVEGEATALYLARLLKPLNIRVSRIAMGVPVGSDLDYADEFTMGKAMEGRERCKCQTHGGTEGGRRHREDKASAAGLGGRLRRPAAEERSRKQALHVEGSAGTPRLFSASLVRRSPGEAGPPSPANRALLRASVYLCASV